MPTVALVLAGTPIGRPEDASPRLAAGASRADVVAAEDTRRLKRLTADLGITLTGRVVSYFEGNEVPRTPVLLEALLAGRPGAAGDRRRDAQRLRPGLPAGRGRGRARHPRHRGPGAVGRADRPGRVRAARRPVLLRGVPAPQGGGARPPAGRAGRRGAHAWSSSRRRTAPRPRWRRWPRRWGGERRAAVCRELTKTHEEVRRGPLAELAAWAADGVRGEVTIVVAGATPAPLSDRRREPPRGRGRARGLGDEPQGGDRGGGPRGRACPSGEVYAAVHVGVHGA